MKNGLHRKVLSRMLLLLLAREHDTTIRRTKCINTRTTTPQLCLPCASPTTNLSCVRQSYLHLSRTRSGPTKPLHGTSFLEHLIDMAMTPIVSDPTSVSGTNLLRRFEPPEPIPTEMASGCARPPVHHSHPPPFPSPTYTLSLLTTPSIVTPV